MNLFVNYYVDKNEERNKELVQCIKNNILCPAIERIYMIGENDYWKQALIHDKLFPIAHSVRPTFRDFFNVINRFTQPNSINIIANSDIFFNESDINYHHFNLLTHNDCYALSRWDVNADGTATHYNNAGSQDTWIFRGAIKMVEGVNFYMGVPGCDNKIAYQLQQAGYKVTNPSLSIKTYHLHLSNIRRMEKRGGKLFRLPKPYLTVHPSLL